jgi:hypothetical protein
VVYNDLLPKLKQSSGRLSPSSKYLEGVNNHSVVSNAHSEHHISLAILSPRGEDGQEGSVFSAAHSSAFDHFPPSMSIIASPPSVRHKGEKPSAAMCSPVGRRFKKPLAAVASPVCGKVENGAVVDVSQELSDIVVGNSEAIVTATIVDASAIESTDRQTSPSLLCPAAVIQFTDDLETRPSTVERLGAAEGVLVMETLVSDTSNGEFLPLMLVELNPLVGMSSTLSTDCVVVDSQQPETVPDVTPSLVVVEPVVATKGSLLHIAKKAKRRPVALSDEVEERSVTTLPADPRGGLLTTLGGDSWSHFAAEVRVVSRPLTTIGTPPEPHFFSYIQQTAPVLASALLSPQANNDEQYQVHGGGVRNLYHHATPGPSSPRPPGGVAGISYPRVAVSIVDSGAIEIRGSESPQSVRTKHAYPPRVVVKQSALTGANSGQSGVVNQNMFGSVANVKFY